jgi:hypothetical protein
MAISRLVDNKKIVMGLPPITPSTSTPDYVSAKNVRHVTVVVTADNGNTVTPSVISLKQATAVAGTNEKALSFTRAWANTDTDASDTLSEVTVTGDAYTLSSTNAKNSMLIIEVPTETLDTNNSFDCLRAATGDAANQVVAVTYFCETREHGGSDPSVITD